MPSEWRQFGPSKFIWNVWLMRFSLIRHLGPFREALKLQRTSCIMCCISLTSRIISRMRCVCRSILTVISILAITSLRLRSGSQCCTPTPETSHSARIVKTMSPHIKVQNQFIKLVLSTGQDWSLYQKLKFYLRELSLCQFIITCSSIFTGNPYDWPGLPVWHAQFEIQSTNMMWHADVKARKCSGPASDVDNSSSMWSWIIMAYFLEFS